MSNEEYYAYEEIIQIYNVYIFTLAFVASFIADYLLTIDDDLCVIHLC